MENKEKESISFILGIKILREGKILKPQIAMRDVNMPIDIVINQIRNVIKMLEEDQYPDFKNNVTKVGMT